MWIISRFMSTSLYTITYPVEHDILIGRDRQRSVSHPGGNGSSIGIVWTIISTVLIRVHCWVHGCNKNKKNIFIQLRISDSFHTKVPIERTYQGHVKSLPTSLRYAATYTPPFAGLFFNIKGFVFGRCFD